MGLGTFSPASDSRPRRELTPEGEFLLHAIGLRGAESSPAKQTLDWNRLLLLAESHGVLPLLCASKTALPDEFLIRSRQQSALSLLLANELGQLLKQFHESGIPVIALKGPILAHTLYGRVGLRPSDDLDLLVRRESFPRAEAKLLALGFSPVSPADNYHRDYFRDGIFVELHFATSSPSAPFFDLTSAWERSLLIQFRGAPARVLSPVDRVIYLSLHGLKHRFARLIWVRDLCLAMHALDSEAWATLLDVASAQRVRNIVLAGAEIAHWCFAFELPTQIQDLLLSQPYLIDDADLIAKGILGRAANPTTSVNDVQTYLKLADPGTRWRQRLKFFHPTDQDYRWAERHRVSRGFMVMIRPLRLIRKYGLTSALRVLFPRG